MPKTGGTGVETPISYLNFDYVFDGPVAAIPSIMSGLAIDGESLWVTDLGTAGIYQLDRRDGSLTSSFIVAGIFSPNGITRVGDVLYITDGVDRIYRYSTAGVQQSSFAVSGASTLSHIDVDGSYLWVNDWTPQIIRRLDLNGNEVQSFRCAPEPQGLCVVGDLLFMFSSLTYHVYVYDKNSGELVQTFQLPGIRPEGLDYDNGRFWHSDRCGYDFPAQNIGMVFRGTLSRDPSHKTPLRFMKDVDVAQGTTTNLNQVGWLCTHGATEATLQARVTYGVGSTVSIIIHVRGSPERGNPDTENLLNFTPGVTANQTVRASATLTPIPRFVQVTVENPDPAVDVEDVEVWAILGR
jgi:hypothetical protein